MLLRIFQWLIGQQWVVGPQQRAKRQQRRVVRVVNQRSIFGGLRQFAGVTWLRVIGLNRQQWFGQFWVGWVR